ncbi:MAG: helix-turn-helix domain-containing protein [Candidatus Scalindua sp.]
MQYHIFTTDWILSQFGDNKSEAISGYKDFVVAGKHEEFPWREIKGQVFLGVEKLVEKYRKLVKKKESIKEIPRVQRYAHRPALGNLFSKNKNRDRSIYEAYVRYGYTMKEIAEYLCVHYTTISRIIRRIEK